VAKRQAERGRQWLFGLLLLGLLLPAVQGWLNMKIFRTAPLAGYQAPAPKPGLIWDSVQAGTYQPALERYLTEHLGFHDRFIRPRNQLAYSLFRQVRVNNVLVGRQGVLFEEGPIRSALGQDVVAAPERQRHVAQLRALQDTLARRGKLLVFVVAPSKAAFYPELLPDEFRQGWRQPSNAELYAPEMRAAGINVLDFGAQFRAWKDTAAYPLFPRGGIHWSLYGVTEAAKVLFPYLEQKGGFDLPDFRTTDREVSTSPRYTDNDMVRAMNLLWEPRAFPMAYPTVVFEAPRPGQHRPRLLVVGDSFVWNLIEHYPYLDNLFDEDSHFWYYNQQVQWRRHNGQLEGETDVSRLDRKAQVLTHDVVLLLFNEHNLVNFDAGFSENTLQAFAASPAGASR
jgi:hypothetical protein